MKNTSKFVPKRYIGEYGRDKIRTIGEKVWDGTITEDECKARCQRIWDAIDHYERALLTPDEAIMDILNA